MLLPHRLQARLPALYSRYPHVTISEFSVDAAVKTCCDRTAERNGLRALLCARRRPAAQTSTINIHVKKVRRIAVAVHVSKTDKKLHSLDAQPTYFLLQICFYKETLPITERARRLERRDAGCKVATEGQSSNPS